MSTKPTVEVTETNFETEVLKSNQPVLVGEFAERYHVTSAHFTATLEVMVTVESNAMRKSLDPETGLALIDPSLAKKEEK